MNTLVTKELFKLHEVFSRATEQQCYGALHAIDTSGQHSYCALGLVHKQVDSNDAIAYAETLANCMIPTEALYRVLSPTGLGILSLQELSKHFDAHKNFITQYGTNHVELSITEILVFLNDILKLPFRSIGRTCIGLYLEV